MKVLIATNHLEVPGGSERWTETMANGFNRMGHTVHLRTHHTGRFSEMLPYPINTTDTDYDFILVNHDMGLVSDCTGFKVFTSHGIIETLERPQQAHVVVGITKEVADYYSLGTVILNPIDLTVFHQTRKRSQEPKSVLAITTSDATWEKVSQAASFLGIKPLRASKFAHVNDIAALINEADIVVSLGRGAYEALACNRPVLVYDERPYNGAKSDGIITPQNFHAIRNNNCSGRCFSVAPDVPHIISEIQSYNSHIDYRPLVSDQSMDIIINEYIYLWKER